MAIYWTEEGSTMEPKRANNSSARSGKPAAGDRPVVDWKPDPAPNRSYSREEMAPIIEAQKAHERAIGAQYPDLKGVIEMPTDE